MFFIGFRLRLKASENTAILIRLWKTIILFDFDFEIWSNLFLQLPLGLPYTKPKQIVLVNDRLTLLYF